MHGLRHRAVALVFGLTVVAQPLAAQSSARTDLLDVLVTADDDGEFLRVTTSDGRSVEGYIRDLDDSVVRLGGGVVELPTIALVERRDRDRSAVENGGLTGGLVGGAALGLLALGLGLGFCEYDCGDVGFFAVGGVAIGALVGGIVGSLIGYSIDPGETEWTEVWPARAND